MSSPQLLNFNVPVQGLTSSQEDLTGYEGRFVILDGNGLVDVASLTDQPTTQGLVCLGVLQRGADTDVVGGCEVVDAGFTNMIVGTGGVSKGDILVPEYAASGTDRGRAISPTSPIAGQFYHAIAKEDGVEDATIRVEIRLNTPLPYEPA